MYEAMVTWLDPNLTGERLVRCTESSKFVEAEFSYNISFKFGTCSTTVKLIIKYSFIVLFESEMCGGFR